MAEAYPKIGAVAVIGGGIAGMQAALDVANGGLKVYLIESEPVIGGQMARLDKTFPTNDCAACMMGPRLAELAHHPRIELLTYTDVMDVAGEPGDFRLTLLRKGRGVDPEKCIACGLCAEKCPVQTEDPFNLGLGKRKAIYIPYPQAVPLVYTIDKTHCRYYTKGICRICEKLCPKNAIIFDQPDQTVQIAAGAIILAGGLATFDARLKGEYGYGRFANVLASPEYERMLSAGGPFQSRIQRLSDGRPPRRIAWIQCVGSRDLQVGRDYCSAVCCMQAAKQAIITKEHDAGIQTTIFHIDVRAHGKGFERFYERSKTENGVRYVRSHISRLVPNPEDDTLNIVYFTPERGLVEKTFDMVILSVGISLNPGMKALLPKLGLGLNAHGFCESEPLYDGLTGCEGIFLCGVMQSPKDIPDTIQQASGVAGRVLALLAQAEPVAVPETKLPAERSVAGLAPRIGVFICHCGVNIAGVVDVARVTAYARTLKHVVYAGDAMFACSVEQQAEIKKVIAEYDLNRVVVASCSPRTHESLFRTTLAQAGLNPYLFELANIREQDAWVHRHEPDAATRKAEDLVRMAVAKAALLKPLKTSAYEIVPRILVLGGGLAGLTAALAAAEQGYETVLVERAAELGGNARTLYYTEDGSSPAAHVQDLIARVKADPLIRVYKEAEIVSVSGASGNFTGILKTAGEKKEIRFGAAIIATGGEEYKPGEYLYGQNPRVITQKEFEALIVSKPDEIRQYRRIVMIQCVGSREPEALYCSRVCCTGAIKNSLKVKAIDPEIGISVLFRDMRTFGFRESYYRRARTAGVIFYRYEPEAKPQVIPEGDFLTITLKDMNLAAKVHLKADLLVLSAAIRPHPDGMRLAADLRLALDQDGFFMEAHPKLRPLDLPKAGFFICGLAQGPRFAPEAISQARGAVARAAAILSKKEMVAGAMVANVDTDLCRACGDCERTCLFEAISVREIGEDCKAAIVTESVCTGCGACSAICPTGAVSVGGFQDDQLGAMIKNAV